MHKILIEIVNMLAIAAIVTIPFLNIKGKGIVAISVISLQVVLSSIVAVYVFAQGATEYYYAGSLNTGIIPIRIDYLSAWFMLIISFTFLTGSWYGIQYLKRYIDQPDNIALHAIAFILVYTSLIDICIVQNGLALLVVWEIMALGSFIIVIFEHYNAETLRAGINFLIQSHICILFLTIGFIWLNVKTGSFDLYAITTYTASQPPMTGLCMFIVFFIGFAIKAGFVPFHTWLPLAHPAAPSHVSGIMSGVIIKIGIYGILRILLLLRTDMVYIGYFILCGSIITGVYGVMLAIVQHNLKKLLAYHSIENIGIIGIGIGLGCLGIGYNNPFLAITGFGGALLHTLNHSLFKSLLFFCAGNVYQARHTMNIESLGGLLKHMPRSGYLFLAGSLAICGLPPFNGFVSEFFIYSGLFNGLQSNNIFLLLFFLFSILGLVLIGGLALMCFTKAFGIVFLGTERGTNHNGMIDESPARMYPLYAIVLAMLLVGLAPVILNPVLLKITSMYQPPTSSATLVQMGKTLDTITTIGWYSLVFIALTTSFYFLRYLVTRKRSNSIDSTWGCAYTGETAKMQYTASSFIRSYRKMAEPLLLIKKDKQRSTSLYPEMAKQATHPDDKLEDWLITSPVLLMKRLLNRFSFLQNGNIQAYILYGFLFIGLVIMTPLVFGKLSSIINFLNQL